MSETRQLTEVVKVRVSAEELSAIRERAENAGLPVSGFIRAAALAKRVEAPSADLLRGLANIGRLGGVLKLALAQVDQGRLPPELRQHIEKTIIELRSASIALQKR